MSLNRTHSDQLALSVLAILTEADGVCGGGNTPAALSAMTNMLIARWGGRTMNALVLALRDGLNSGKVFGKLTYPLIGEWLLDHEEAFEAGSYAQHLGTK